MKKINFVFWIISASIILASCDNSGGSKRTEKLNTQLKFNADSIKLTKFNADSVEITKLVRDLYEWHQTKYLNVGFDFKGNTHSDSIFTGIDWTAYNKEVDVFKKTNFFSQEFLDKHRAIATTIDSSIKKAGVEWRNYNDGIPLWSTDSDDWCGCQDSPDDYWKRLNINNLKFNDNTAVFNWAWGITDGIDPPFKYEMKAKKEDGIWRISYMDGFSHYGTVADYDKMMSQSK